MRITKMMITVLAVGASCLMARSSVAQDDAAIPRRPEGLKYPPLSYEPPAAADYRVALQSGPVAYIVPNRELPLVNIVIYAHVGSYLEPAGKEGVAELTGNLLTHGGTKSKERRRTGRTTRIPRGATGLDCWRNPGSVSVNLLSKDLDEGLGILREVLTKPRFQDDKITLRKQQTLQGMKQRNDDSEAIEAREAGFLAYGEKFWANDYDTAASVESITREDMEDFHRKWFHPKNFIVAVSGDFDRDEMKAKLEKLFADWPFVGEQPPPIPTNTEIAAPGVYIVDKDVNQGRVSIMLPGIMRNNPDYLDLLVMNDILGGGGFTSHIMSSVRSDEGLAYSAYSMFPGGIYYPLNFTAAYQSKSRTVTYAASIVLKELKKMAEAPPTDEELNISKHGWIDRLPHNFATKTQVASVLAQEEFTGRYASDPGFWKEFRKRIGAITKEDVLRVAKKYLTPDKAIILIVGNKEEISKKLPEHPVTLQELTGGAVTDLPLRDPMTMKPVTASIK